MTCKVQGCENTHEAHGLCKAHYNQAVRKGEIVTVKGRGRPRIYTDEQRKEVAREKAKRAYRRKVLANPKPPRSNRGDNPCYVMYINSRKRARDLGLPLDLKLEDIIMVDVCPLLGIPLIRGIGVYSDNSPTLDRIIPELGYVKGNVQVISMRANRIKDNSTFEEFEMMYHNWRNSRNLT
jgi:hypothetical protein